MSHFITCGNINKNIIYIIIGGLSKFVADVILYESGIKITKDKQHPYLLGINSGLGMSLSLIPFIFITIQSRRQKRKNALNLIDKKLIIKDSYKVLFKKMRFKKYLLILLSSILDSSQKFLTHNFKAKIEQNFWIFDIVFICAFSVLILKTKLYSYQYLSLSIIIILGIILNVIILYGDAGFEIESVLYVLSIEILYSLKIVINKYSLEYHYCSPYEISFYEGLLNLILNFILLISTDKDNYHDYFKEIDFIEIILVILLMLTRLGFNLFSIITMEIYTTSHVALILIIGEIYFTFQFENTFKFYAKLVIYCFLLFIVLVFTEIIEINYCELSKNTRNNIMKRADLQYDQTDFRSDTSSFDENEEEEEEDNNNQEKMNELKLNH